MDIRKARKIAQAIATSTREELHTAFHRLDRNHQEKQNELDLKLARAIWNYYAKETV